MFTEIDVHEDDDNFISLTGLLNKIILINNKLRFKEQSIVNPISNDIDYYVLRLKRTKSSAA